MTDATMNRVSGIEPAQQTAAKVAGAILLVAMALSMLVELGGFGAIAISNDPAETAASLRAAEPLIRLAIVAGLLCFITDLAIGAAFYVMLRRINQGMAAFGAFLRVANGIVLCLSCVALLAALRLVSGAPYLEGFGAAQLDALARLMMGVRTDTMSIAWVFLGLGQTVFAWLLWKSRYVPRWLASPGIFASLLLACGPLVLMAAPDLRGALGMTYMAPMFFYEVTLGIWFLVRGLREPA